MKKSNQDKTIHVPSTSNHNWRLIIIEFLMMLLLVYSKCTTIQVKIAKLSINFPKF